VAEERGVTDPAGLFVGAALKSRRWFAAVPHVVLLVRGELMKPHTAIWVGHVVIVAWARRAPGFPSLETGGCVARVHSCGGGKFAVDNS